MLRHCRQMKPQRAHIARLSRTSMLKLAYPRVPFIDGFSYLRELIVLFIKSVSSAYKLPLIDPFSPISR